MRLSLYPWDTAFRWMLMSQLRAFMRMEVVSLYDGKAESFPHSYEEMLLPVTYKYASPHPAISGNNIVEIYHNTDQNQYGEERRNIEWTHLKESVGYYVEFMEAR